MKTLEDLTTFLLQHEKMVVFGDLGRYPQRLIESLQSIPHLQIIIITQDILPYSDDRIRILCSADQIDGKCDLLVYLEPKTLSMPQKHPLASRAVIFTSHFSFNVSCKEWWTTVCFFSKMDPEGTRQLLEKQDYSIQTGNIGLIKGNHTHVITISGSESNAPQYRDTYVIVDLTKFSKDVLSMYLAFWNAFDYLLEHKLYIDRWVICFPENGRQSFLRFTQKILDVLFCKKIEHGNVQHLRDIVTLLPFYKSGIIDKTFDIKVSYFGGIPFVNPTTVENVCKTAVTYNAIPIAKNIFWVQ